ncbi:MAG TPA: NUDIX domain-containing protein [Bryobacteraceae bacterium]|nr:NUDIX domain-containing protein [Bryobacteraceae bacterium]
MSEGLPRVGSALIVRDEANRILLGKRNKDPQRGNWVLPGGKIHAFESIADAAARELAEETGLEVEVQHQFRVYEVINAPQEHRIVIYSWAKAVGGVLRASDDISEVKFVSLHELGDLPLTPLVRAVLADAGYIGEKLPTHFEPSGSSALWLFPVPIAGAVRRRSKRHGPRTPRGQGRISPVYVQGSLRFESAGSD